MSKKTNRGRNNILFLLCILLTLSISGASAGTITVCSTGCDYNNIQDAIDVSKNEDTVEVQSGTYEKVNINKRITIKGVDTGKGMPVISSGNSKDPAITISEKDVKLEGFAAKNSWAGIKVTSKKNIITRNKLKNNIIGIICLPDFRKKSLCSDNSVYNNDFFNNKYDIYDLGTQNMWDHNGIGNHYSNYDETAEGCYDADGDNICDKPHKLMLNSQDTYPLVEWIKPITKTVDQQTETHIKLDKGKGTAVFKTSKGNIEELSVISEKDLPTGLPTHVDLRYGLFKFDIKGLNTGETVDMMITFQDDIPKETTYWKYGPTHADPTPHWYTIPITIDGNKLTFKVTDGGLGDDDLTANRKIRDPSGPAIPQLPTQNVPEFPAIAVPIILILGLLFIIRKKK